MLHYQPIKYVPKDKDDAINNELTLIRRNPFELMMAIKLSRQCFKLFWWDVVTCCCSVIWIILIFSLICNNKKLAREPDFFLAKIIRLSSQQLSFYFFLKIISHTHLWFEYFYWTFLISPNDQKRSLFFKIFLGSYRKLQVSVVLKCATFIKLNATLRIYELMYLFPCIYWAIVITSDYA